MKIHAGGDDEFDLIFFLQYFPSQLICETKKQSLKLGMPLFKVG